MHGLSEGHFIGRLTPPNDSSNPRRPSRMKRPLTTAWLRLKQALSIETRRDLFRRYALMNHWQNAESVSGPGSTVENTTHLRKELPRLFEQFEIKRMLDAPCGDFNWMRLVEHPGVQYIGGDIVPELVKANNMTYADSSRRFMLCDILLDDLPTVDLWICRDVLFHFSYADIFQTFKNLLRSDITYLLTTDHPGQKVNSDIRTGGFRLMNVMREPFCFPDPHLWIDDSFQHFPTRRMGLWEVESLRAALSENTAYQRAIS